MWTTEQLRTFLAATADDRLAALWRLVAATGLRRLEMVGLRWEHVDLERGRIVIRQHVVDTGAGLATGEPKTARGERLLPLDEGTVRGLRRHQQVQDHERAMLPPRYAPSGHVFTRLDGQVLRPEYVTRRFQRLAKDAGLPVIKLHELRHTNASIALDLGVEIKVMTERLGHSTTSFTWDRYTHVLPVTDGPPRTPSGRPWSCRTSWSPNTRIARG